MNKKLLLLNILFLTSFLAARIQQINPELLVAATQNDVEKMQELISQGVDIDVQNEDGKTALILASELGKEKAVRFLLSNGANPNVAIIGVSSSCTEEESPDFPVMCADVLPGGKPPFTVRKGWTALHFATDKKIASLLLKDGALIDSKDGQGKTPLMFAVSRGDVPLTKLFIRRGADINTKSNSKRSALYYAVAYADRTGDNGIMIIKELVNGGALVDDEIIATAEKRKNHNKITPILTGRPSKGLKGLIVHTA